MCFLYNVEITKINDIFDFKKTIYVDRFLFKNIK